jgi:hypothetical protein
MGPDLYYQTRLVAFLDVMGFQQLLSGDEPNKKLKNYYENIFEFLDEKSNVYQKFGNEDSFKKLLVSDSIIMSIVIDPEAENVIEKAARFFSSVSLIQYLLCTKSQVWTRGVIALGNLFIDESTNVLVGPAFVAAYNLEKVADYPRVIVDPSVCRGLKLTSNEFIEKLNSTNYKGVLLQKPKTENLSSIGRPTFNRDSLQLDWFRHAFDRSEILNKFFEDFADRSTLNQPLFEKSQKLGAYLRESFFQETIDRENGMRDRHKKIDQLLKNVGF